jgi:DNA helicase-2/ATP-dependent DNA helicase PcrA
MTIHAVKGLEFDNVFITGMEEGIFPHYNSINAGSISAIEEERRLCYVAITRAKKNLWMLNAKKRMLFGNTQINMPSRFMDEIDSKYLEEENNRTSIISKVVNFVKEDKFRTDDVSYNVGDHVKHDEFGEGVVVSCDKSLVTIAFPHPYGIKKIMAKHKSISKI